MNSSLNAELNEIVILFFDICTNFIKITNVVGMYLRPAPKSAS